MCPSFCLGALFYARTNTDCLHSDDRGTTFVYKILFSLSQVVEFLENDNIDIHYFIDWLNAMIGKLIYDHVFEAKIFCYYILPQR